MHGSLSSSPYITLTPDTIVRARGDWLEAAIQEERINLLGGGDTPADTARLDAALRAQAEDGLRPATAWHRNPARDETEPASSTLYPEPEPAQVG